MSPEKSRKCFLPASLPAVALTALLLTGSYQPVFCQVAYPAEKIMPGSDSSRKPLPVPEMAYDPDTKTAYAAFGTAQSLYVHLEVMDPGQQRKIIQNGLELWIDVKGKKNKKTGIAYPLPDKERAFTPPGDKRSDPAERLNVRKALEPVLARKKEMTVTGFVNEVNGLQPVHLRDGFQVTLHFKNDTLVYDVEIPLNVFTRPLAPDKIINIGIIEKGLLPSGLNEGGMPEGGGAPGGGENGPPGGPPGNGGGAPPDGGGPPDGMPPGGEEMQQAFRDNVIWFTFTFSQSRRTVQ
jgi:hypothetical protein